MELGPAIPILRILDEAKAREFYLGFLGFEVEFEHRFEPGMPLYMGIVRGGCKLHLSEHHGDGVPGVRVRIRCDDVEAYQQQLLAKGYRYARPGLVDQDWGMRECTVGDGFGNSLTFWRDLR